MVAVMATALTMTAQVTTSGIYGKVTAGNEDIIGATVDAVHTPSGTHYNAVTNEKGRYSIQGMRVGGPYTVTITYIGFKDDVRSNIYLALGEPTGIDADLKEDAQLLGEVVVTGQAGRGGNGASSNFDLEQIENAPTIDRNIYDIAKLSPLVNNNKFGGISIAGSNNRYNSFQIDGMVSNDVFGLASSGTNGGQSGANPISMDAIEQVQVVASPFDVRQSGFTGGAINAITKSGTNEVKASAYGYYTDENMYGRWNQLYDRKEKLTKETTQTYGFTIGAPIVKDKLFIFGSLEYKKNSYPSSYYAGADGYFMAEELAQAIAQRYYDVTGIQESWNRKNVDTKSLQLMARLDWNINAKHKLSFRYQMNDSYKDSGTSGARTFYFNNSSYRFKNNTHAFMAELNSRFSNTVYNELRAGLSLVRDKRDVPYGAPTIYITKAGTYDLATGKETSGSNVINLGTEYSSGVNSLDQDIWTLEDNLSLYLGNHTVTLGTHNEIYNMKNGFIQCAYGEFVYNTGLTGFFNDSNSSWQYKYSDSAVTGTSMWRTPFKAGQFGIYAQDKWDPSTRLQITYGVRLDVPVYLNGPTTNDEFNTTSYSTDNDAVVGRKPKSQLMFSPRVGFRWYTNDSHTSLLRGGVGIFNGRAPFVWIENAWANTGVEMKGTTIYSPDAPTFLNDGTKDAQDILAASTSGKASKPDINLVSRNFKFPQVFRANLAWEVQLPHQVKLTLEGLYSRSFNNIWYENFALVDNGTKVYAVNSDYENSATTYYTRDLGSYNSIINLANNNKGYSYSLSAKLEKSFDFGLDLMASYTFGHSYSVNEGTSSTAASNWGYYYCVDPNSADLSYSMYDVPHKALISATYNSKKYGNGRWQTHVSLVYNGYSGQRYSLIMSDASSASFNGDYRTGNTLLYIPTAEELDHMNFATANDRNQFAAWIITDKYAKDHRGQYARRNSNSAPWENHFNLHVAQDFYYLKERGSKIELVLDIINAANLLNHDWGTYYASSYAQSILNVESVKTDANGNKYATYSFVGNAPTISEFYSRWHAQIGFRVTF